MESNNKNTIGKYFWQKQKIWFLSSVSIMASMRKISELQKINAKPCIELKMQPEVLHAF